jgi:hypothetical protein
MSPVNLTSDIWLLTSIFRCLPENKKPPEQKSRRQYNHHQNSPSVSVLDRYKRLVIKKHLVIACYCNISGMVQVPSGPIAYVLYHGLSPRNNLIFSELPL